MTAPTPAAEPTVEVQSGGGGSSAAPAAQTEPKRTLESSLTGLDDDTRRFVLDELHKARNEAQGLRTRLKEAEPKISEYDALIEASKTDLERAQEAATVANRRADSLVTRAVKAEIKAAASGFADPSDAVAFLDPSKYAGDDGEIDTKQIAADLAALLTSKPHLGRGAQALAPNPAQGTGAGGHAAGQLTKEDVERLYAAGKYDEIEKARTDGRLAALLGT